MIFVIGWLVCAIATMAFVCVKWFGYVTNRDALVAALYCAIAWPFVWLVLGWIVLEDGALSEWLDKPFYKSRSE